jgi:hypothetical protein
MVISMKSDRAQAQARLSSFPSDQLSPIISLPLYSIPFHSTPSSPRPHLAPLRSASIFSSLSSIFMISFPSISAFSIEYLP